MPEIVPVDGLMLMPVGSGVVVDMEYVSGGGVAPPEPLTGVNGVTDSWFCVSVIDGMSVVATTPLLTEREKLPRPLIR